MDDAKVVTYTFYLCIPFLIKHLESGKKDAKVAVSDDNTSYITRKVSIKERSYSFATVFHKIRILL